MLEFFESEKVDAQLIRGTAGSYVDGEWIPAYDTALPIRIIVPQPVKASELQPLEDGEHVSDFVVIWTEMAIRPRRDYIESDIILYGGEEYRVWQTNDRSVLGNHYRAILRRIENCV